MNKTKQNERTETVSSTPPPQTKSYDDAFKQAAVENWLKSEQRDILKKPLGIFTEPSSSAIKPSKA